MYPIKFYLVRSAFKKKKSDAFSFPDSGWDFINTRPALKEMFERSTSTKKKKKAEVHKTLSEW